MPVTSANRITLVQNGTVDIECGSTTNNLERQKQVGFSTTIFVIGTRLMTKKDSGIKDFARSRRQECRDDRRNDLRAPVAQDERRQADEDEHHLGQGSRRAS
jgi:ABC-type amino acid transport substrate-binding protein